MILLTGGVHGRVGCGWGHACVAGGHTWRGSCVAKRGHVWQRSVTTRAVSILLECILVSNYISLKYIRSRFDALLTRLASVTANSHRSPPLFSRRLSTNTQKSSRINRPLVRLGGSALFELCGGVHDIRSLRFTSRVTPLPVYIAELLHGHPSDFRTKQ